MPDVTPNPVSDLLAALVDGLKSAVAPLSRLAADKVAAGLGLTDPADVAQVEAVASGVASIGLKLVALKLAKKAVAAAPLPVPVG